MLSRSTLLVTALLLAMPLFAQEEEAEGDESPWSGTVKLGYLATTGNTESQSMNAGFEINYTLELWAHQATGAAIGTSESNISTAEA